MNRAQTLDGQGKGFNAFASNFTAVNYIFTTCKSNKVTLRRRFKLKVCFMADEFHFLTEARHGHNIVF